MQYYQITNFLKDGVAQYKGLALTSFVPGSQHIDWDNDMCIIASYDETPIAHDDVTVLTEMQYEEMKEVLLAQAEANRPPSPEDEIATLKQQLADTEKRMDEAIVELTLAMTMGGMPNV